MELKILPAYEYQEEIRALFCEYTALLIAGDGTFKEYLAVQNYDEEISHLSSKYGLPGGRLYIAFYDGEAAGCVGLRKIDEKNCELKRLYVKSAFRGCIPRKAYRQYIDSADYQGCKRNRIFTYTAGYASVFDECTLFV